MAKKRQQKSLSSLIGKREINAEEIEKAAETVHQKETGTTAAKPKRKPATKQKAPEKLIRVSVDTPHSLYLKCKMATLEEEGIGSLKDFYLHCVRDYLERNGKM